MGYAIIALFAVLLLGGLSQWARILRDRPAGQPAERPGGAG